MVILSLVSFLKELDGGNIWPSLSITDIDCGVALAITAFFSWSSVWFYFPIPLVAGIDLDAMVPLCQNQCRLLLHQN